MALPIETQQQIIDLVRRAGAEIMTYWRRADTQTGVKADGSDITAADLASDAILIKGLREILPGYAILTEETKDAFIAEHKVMPARAVVVDPLDGTTFFKNGLDNFMVLVGVLHDHQVVYGVQSFPAHEIVYAAHHGQGTWLHDKALPARRVTILPKDPNDKIWRYYANPNTTPPEFFVAVDDVLRRHGFTPEHIAPEKIYLGHRLIAGACDTDLSCATRDARHNHAAGGLWDVAAKDVITREAGGFFSDGLGRPYDYSQSDYELYDKIASRQCDFMDELLDAIRPFVMDAAP